MKFSPLLFLLLVVPIVTSFFIDSIFKTSCGKKTDCESCARTRLSSDSTKNCRWCPRTNKCHTPGDVFTNRCDPVQNIVYKRDCPSKCQQKYPYEERIAKKMLVLSGAAYLANSQQCLNNGLTNDEFRVTDIFTYKCGESSPDCTAILAVSKPLKAIALAFRGTTGQSQLFEQGVTILFRDRKQFGNRGLVQSYFHDAFMGLRPCLTAGLNRQRNLHPNYDIWVTGHSLGGALASLAANEISHQIDSNRGVQNDRIKLITFGQPRTGDFAYAINHDRFVPYSFRVVNKGDLVPHLPSCSKELISLGTFRCEPFSSSNFHHGVEIWYEKGMAKAGSQRRNCRGPPCNEDLSCSNKPRFLYSVSEHTLTKYFGGINLSARCVGGVYNEYSRPGPKATAVTRPTYKDTCQTFKYN